MEVKIQNIEHFIELYKAFEKVRAVLYGADTGVFVEKTNTYQNLVEALSYYLKKKAKTEDRMIIDAQLGLSEVIKTLEKEEQILRYEVEN